MGLMDFARNAGAKVGIGKSTKERKDEAAAKVAAEKAAVAAQKAKEQMMAETNARVAAAKAKAEKDAVEKAAAEAAEKAAAAKVAAAMAAAEAREEAEKSTELEDFVQKMGLKVSNLDIRYNDGCAYVRGECDSQEDLEKLVLAIGNVGEVDRVIDTVSVKAESDPSGTHVVESGDTLSKIAKKAYGDASKYPIIFEANKPMLKDPDEIFPGQVLRIPALT
jgi:nucleoid-associated protein YgaU